MARRNRMTEIEEEKGLPMSEILTQLYRQYNSQKEIARQLNISQPALSLWLVRLGLKEKTILVQRDESPMLSPSAAVESLAAYPRESEVVVS